MCQGSDYYPDCAEIVYTTVILYSFLFIFFSHSFSNYEQKMDEKVELLKEYNLP